MAHRICCHESRGYSQWQQQQKKQQRAKHSGVGTVFERTEKESRRVQSPSQGAFGSRDDPYRPNLPDAVPLSVAVCRRNGGALSIVAKSAAITQANP